MEVRSSLFESRDPSAASNVKRNSIDCKAEREERRRL